MKRKVIFIIFSIVMMMIVTMNVNGLCTSRKYSKLKMLAYKAELSYELKFDQAHRPYFEIAVNNIEEEILINFSGVMYDPEGSTFVIPTKVIGGETYEVKLYGGYDTACAEEYLYTKTITIPKYNVYSEREECIEYEEFYLCNKWYAGTIVNDRQFENELEVYKNSIKEEDEEEKKEESKTIIDKIIDIYKENKTIIIPIIALIVVLIGYKVIVKIKRRRNRVKLGTK